MDETKNPIPQQDPNAGQTPVPEKKPEGFTPEPAAPQTPEETPQM